MDIGTIVFRGLAGPEHAIGTVRLRPNEEGTASDLFGSTFILEMGQHYDRYVISNAIPSFQAVPSIYSSAAIAASYEVTGARSQLDWCTFSALRC